MRIIQRIPPLALVDAPNRVLERATDVKESGVMNGTPRRCSGWAISSEALVFLVHFDERIGQIRQV